MLKDNNSIYYISKQEEMQEFVFLLPYKHKKRCSTEQRFLTSFSSLPQGLLILRHSLCRHLMDLHTTSEGAI